MRYGSNFLPPRGGVVAVDSSISLSLSMPLDKFAELAKEIVIEIFSSP